MFGTLYMSNAVINNRDKKLSETKVIFAIRGARYQLKKILYKHLIMIAVLPRKSTGITRMNYRILNPACKEEE